MKQTKPCYSGVGSEKPIDDLLCDRQARGTGEEKDLAVCWRLAQPNIWQRLERRAQTQA